MSSIFRKDDNVRNHPKRNVFDLSSQNNLTLNFGKLVTVFKKEVIPGDSIKLDPTFAIRYLPQVFPVQTRQRASVKYYYVRNRNLWKDWPDFIGRTKEGLTMPYLKFNDESRKVLAPSSPADYMGYPIHVNPVVQKNRFDGTNVLKLGSPNFVASNETALIPSSNVVLGKYKNDPYSIYTTKSLNTQFYLPADAPTSTGLRNFELSWLYGGIQSAVPTAGYNLALQNNVNGINVINPTIFATDAIYFYLFRKPWKPTSGAITAVQNSNFQSYIIYRTISGNDVLQYSSSGTYNVQGFITYNHWNGTSYVSKQEEVASVVGIIIIKKGLTTSAPPVPQSTMTISLLENEDVCWCDVHLDDFPFASDAHPDRIRLNALLPRAFESVYNCNIRNSENNPFMVDGQPEYNKYILSDEGGATDALYLFTQYYCNWADDRFTTALPSPQQGNAPLVGLTGTQGATLVVGNEDGTQQRIKLEVDADTGYVIAVDASQSDANDDLISQTWNAVDYGISINDLRNVNSYQRWKENNVRGGYKYRDQIQSHYGVSVRFDVLDMPEFIGGVSRDVNVQQVTATSSTEDAKLGEIAGQSYITGEGHSIEHYCDEHGFIIGVMCVYPMPLYQDMLDKTLIKQDPFDFFFPEFSKIGYQPITNKEIAFSQSVLEENSDEVFGYQRPWYEYLESLDEIHGLYQTDFRGFILGRDLGNVPQLGSDFLTLHPDDLNNTFYSEDDKDKLLGQIYHKVSMKRPLPLTGIPALE